MTRLALISQSDAARTGLRDALGDDVELVTWWPRDDEGALSIVKQVTLDPPAVVLLGHDLPLDRAIEIATAFDEERPEIGVMLIARPTPDLWERALRAGVRDVLTPDQAGDTVREIVERAIDVAQRRRANLADAPPEAAGGRVIVVLSPKGGAGKTTIASNVAVGLAGAAPRQVVLFDTDLQFGDVANALRLIPEVSFADSVRAGLPDGTAMKAALTFHPSGLFALCAPDMPAEADDITGEHVGRAIDLLHAEFEYLVVDTDAGLGERTLAAIDRATDLIFVCATDVPSVRALRKELEALDMLGMNHQRRHFVLNRADAKVGLSAEDIQATVNQQIDVFIPSSRSVPVSMNQGTPLLESGTASPALKGLTQLVGRFVDVAPPEAAPRRAARRRRKET